MQLYTIETGYFKLDGGAMFGVVPKVLWSKTNPSDNNKVEEEVRKEVVSLCSSFPIYKNLRK